MLSPDRNHNDEPRRDYLYTALKVAAVLVFVVMLAGFVFFFLQ